MVHAPTLGKFASLVKAPLPCNDWQTYQVAKTPEQTFADNLKWLKEATVFDSQAKIGAAAGKTDQRTIGRFMNVEHSPTLDKISALAVALKIEAWQLLAPDFGAGYFVIKDNQIVPVARPSAQLKQTKRTGTSG